MLHFADRHRVPLYAAQFSSSGQPGKAPRSLRIIVADDDPDMALSLTMLLREEGHDVRAYHSGRHVMGAVIDLDPDAVVLDINLPEVSGWQLASTIRARRTRKQPLLIGISGVFTQGGDKVLAQINGFDYYLVKPYPPEDLLKLLAPLRSPTSDRAGPQVAVNADPDDTYRAALVRAAVLLGGTVPLARRLQVPMPDLTRWLAGADRPSIGSFLKVIDILLSDTRGDRSGPGR